MSQDELQTLRDEAASWLARMMRPDAVRVREDFEAWLATDENHRQVYDRLSRRFAHSQILARSPVYGTDRGIRPRPRWILPVGAGLAAAAALLFTISHIPGSLSERARSSASSAGTLTAGDGALRIATRTGEIRRIRLPDGSQITLDTGAILNVAYDDQQRLLHLVRGRARFDVVHEHRPFVVAAGEGTVFARGTLFDVEVSDGGKIRVSLLRGVVDVRANRTAGPVVRRLLVSQQAEYDQAGFVSVPVALPAQSLDWPSGLLDVDAMPLSGLLSRANSYATVPIEADGQDLAALKVSGRFRVDQPYLLAQNLADLFKLTIDRSRPDKIILRRALFRPGPS